MAAPVPCVTTVLGVRVWMATTLADLQAMTTSTRGPEGEVLHVNDQAQVHFATAASGGSNWLGFHVMYVCVAVAAGSATWTGIVLTLPGQVNAKLRETKVVRRTTTGTARRWFAADGDGDGASSTGTGNTFIAPADGQIVRVTVRPGSAGGSTEFRVYVNGAVAETVTETTSAGTVTDADFTTGTFSKGDRISVSTNPSTDMGNVPGMIVIEWDWRTL